MAISKKVEIKQISNGFIVEHENINSESWTDKVEKFIETIEDVGVYIKLFYADAKIRDEKESKNV